MSKGFVWDIESSGLLDESTIDYTKSPYVLKPSFILHCIVVVDKDTKNVTAFYDGNNIIFDGREHNIVAGNYKYTLKDYIPQEYTRKYLKDFPEWVKENAENSVVIAHNQINFDLLTCKLYYGMPYTVEKDTWCGMPVEFVDTLVLSKTLNPDRFGGHSLDNLSSKTGVRKIEFRKDMPADERFKYFGADMLYYNIYDCLSNLEVYNMLNKEAEGWDWSDAISLEKSVAEIITRQSHRGFLFDKDLAEISIKELDSLMQERRARVEPLLPPKEATQALKKEYTPPKNQFKKDGSLSSNILKWVEKHGGEFVNENTQVSIFGKIYDLPLPQTPLIESVPATIDDSTHIKGWLVSLGWEPSEWKEKDITVDTKKQKLSNDKFKQTVERYVDQTLKSPFCQHRCEYLKTTPQMLRTFLLSANTQKPVRVLTNPNFTVGQEKELCRDLERISETFPYVKDVVEYLTYKHRRNSILGGGVDWEDEEDAEKGYLASVRADGRIPTPADTCGAATSRMKHKLVANIPRITSLYGKNMRGLFGVDKAGYYQIGYDFDSLEAREEAHYCYRYEAEPREYCNSLLMEKPHDVHSMMAKRISKIIKKDFGRSPAKSTKYACLPLHTKVLTSGGWKYYEEIAVGESVLSFNADKGVVEMDTVLHKHFFKDKEVYSYSNKYDSFACTEDHRWWGWRRSKSRAGSKKVFGFFEAKDFTQEHNIILTAPYVGNSFCSVSVDECRLLGWLASDGYWSWSKKGEGTSCAGGRRKDVHASIAQSQKKFWREVEDVLESLSVDYLKTVKKTEGENSVNFYKIRSKWMRPFLDRVFPGRKDKHDVDWVQFVLSLNRDCLNAFYDAFYLGDGHVKGDEEIISQNLGNIFDGVATAAQLLGKGRISFNEKNGSPSPMKDIRVQKRKHLTCQEITKKSLGVQDTFCLTTNNGSFIIWQDDFMGITGNCTYGAQAKKIAKTIGEDVHTGEIIFNAFWEAAKPLSDLKDRLKLYWEKQGKKKFILGIDGRKVPTRSAHAILNSLFQSAGVICAKRAMVIHDRLLKQHGLSVDFFMEDWRNKTFAQQIIAYHDEAQLEVSKSLVQFKMFASEDAAKEFKRNETKVWSDIKYSDKLQKWYVAYSLVGELAARSVKEAGEYYNLNVDLTAGYVVGQSWADCH